MSKRKFPEDRPDQKLPPGKKPRKDKEPLTTAASAARKAPSQAGPRDAAALDRTGDNISRGGQDMAAKKEKARRMADEDSRKMHQNARNGGARTNTKGHEGRVTQNDIDEFDEEAYPW